MPAVTYDLEIEAGAVLDVTFEWRDTTNTGDLIDTADYEPHMQIRSKAGGAVLATYVEGHGLHLDGGVLTLRIGADGTSALLPATRGVYDIELHNTSDPTDVIRLAQGRVTISPDVTRDDVDVTP